MTNRGVRAVRGAVRLAPFLTSFLGAECHSLKMQRVAFRQAYHMAKGQNGER